MTSLPIGQENRLNCRSATPEVTWAFGECNTALATAADDHARSFLRLPESSGSSAEDGLLLRVEEGPHPLTLTSYHNQSGIPQVSQVTRNLWLRAIQDFNKFTDTQFPVSHQAEQSQSRVVTQCLKEPFEVERLLPI